ncbi:protein mono-ADP-ribosyltransferase PARP16 isoform X2 [Nilaparvata lugens]|uniref:protein mono-ADP-ribosyltransferase PARP16 isoform X2 n=1 Tax=Nilaparvata lugens TaxID=108931 RepID=UPI00193DAFF3|nr:protein mono-ADP-ribosyltransferase PARP16 isoform X2 [Nilaparvata lugens]
MFINKEKDMNSLLEVVDRTPSFSLLKKVLSSSKSSMIADVIDLVHWVLVQSKGPTFKSIAKNQFESVLNKVPCDTAAKRPNCIYEVVYPENMGSSVKWSKLKEEYGSLYAYHGSKLENFHSIINNGLLVSLTKTAVFGLGVYLSSELLVSLPYSSTGFGWGKSVMGGELSVVALCEAINHPSVHCQTKTGDKSRAFANDSMAGEVPHKYYVVANSDLVRIRYLLFYTRSLPKPEHSGQMKQGSWFWWLGQHKLLAGIFGYVILLASLGLSNNQNVMRYYRMFLNKAGLLS